LFKKIFIITGESSGDKIGSLVIKKLKEKNLDIQFLAMGEKILNQKKLIVYLTLMKLLIWDLLMF